MPKAILFGLTACQNADRLKRLLETDWQVVPILDETKMDPLCEELLDADALISLTWDDRMGENAPRLRLIHALGAGVDNFFVESFPDDCSLCNVYEHAVPVAEYVLGMIVALTVGFKHHDARLRQGYWDGTGRRDGEPHEELAGKTLGLIGFGTVGHEITKRAAAFDLRIRAIRSQPEASPADERLDWLGGPDRLQDLLSESDYVVACCTLNDQTRNMLNAETLGWMKPTAYLINVARGEIAEQQSLYTALHEQRIAGAAIDVWCRYPESGDQQMLPAELPFHELENVLITPHMSAWTHAMIERRWKKIASNLDALVQGQPLQNVAARKH